jgi:hypothetical protein
MRDRRAAMDAVYYKAQQLFSRSNVMTELVPVIHSAPLR